MEVIWRGCQSAVLGRFVSVCRMSVVICSRYVSGRTVGEGGVLCLLAIWCRRCARLREMDG